MTRIERSALVDYSPRQMFELVRDVGSYPQFLSWCTAASVENEEDDVQLAGLEVRLAGFTRQFKTRNTLTPPDRIDMELVSGPFRELDGTWTFDHVGESGCRVGLVLAFEFSSRLLSGALERGFARVADRLVDDFCQRAEQVHGG